MEGLPGMQAFCLFDLSPTSPLLSGLSLNNGSNSNDAAEKNEKENVKLPGLNDDITGVPILLEISDRMICSACQCVFESREEQKEHYTLDWHQFNLKRKLKGAVALNEEEFQERTRAGDVSSISGSDSESSDEGDAAASDPDTALVPGHPTRSPKVLFRNQQGQRLSVYRCVLGARKDGDLNPEELLSRVQSLQDQAVVVILMAGGGHFAGAVYKGKEAVKHKTFHRYTVRARRGTSQAVHDAHTRNHIAKSAGATLRRYNQAALITDINELLQSWAQDLAEAREIFLRAPRADKTLFLGRNSPIPRKDPRVHRIPFSTRRATYREVQRVHTQLFTLEVYERDTPVSGLTRTREKTIKPRKPVPSESKEEAPEAAEQSEEEEAGLAEEFVAEELTLSTLHLREYEVQPKRKRKKKRKKVSAETVHGSDVTEPDSTCRRLIEESGDSHMNDHPSGPVNLERTVSALDGDELCTIRDTLFTCCKTGDCEAAKRVLQDLLPSSTNQSPPTTAPGSQVLMRLVNERLPLEERTLLHVAASAGRGEMAYLLMEAGWDPALRDSSARTPYSLCADKRTRNRFRKYREDRPDRYNYSKSQIPGPVPDEVETQRAERKRIQKVQRKLREKEEKEERMRREAEEDMKKRFAALSDREKRAVAAERRLAIQRNFTKDTAAADVRRCWLCGESFLGKVPFEYLDFAFCSTQCLQEHRRSQSEKKDGAR